MGQIKVFGFRSHLHPIRLQVSEMIHSCLIDAFEYPKEKKAHRFIYLEEDSFFYFDTRSSKHTIVEISVFEGRKVETKKRLIKLLFDRFADELKISPIDLEITIFETPRHNWGIRGYSGDELPLNYNVNV